jgi:hypothetical protein
VPTPASRNKQPLTREQLADLIEQHAKDVIEVVLRALRESPGAAGGVAVASGPSPPASSVGDQPSPGTTGVKGSEAGVAWHQIGFVEGFEHRWPEGWEHYPEMRVYEGRDDQGVVRLAIGQPDKPLPNLYGRERRWVSIWEVINGKPREQRANFVETDDFATSGERIALISGKGGRKKGLYSPGEEDQLPEIYEGMRLEVQRDRINGPQAKNRLGVVATDTEIEDMLNHALAHVRLRSSRRSDGS